MIDLTCQNHPYNVTLQIRSTSYVNLIIRF